MAEIHEGGCLCGAVRYRVAGEPTVAGVCHCSFCKRRTGSPFGMYAYFDERVVENSTNLTPTRCCKYRATI
jgi:hypothetical protein